MGNTVLDILSLQYGPIKYTHYGGSTQYFNRRTPHF